MRPLSEATARVAGQCCERKYIALGRIVKHWGDIVGQSLADKAQPVKLHFRKVPKGAPSKTSLDIAVSSAHATVLHYQKGLILERINQLFGEDWVASIRFVNTPSSAQDISRYIKKPSTPLTVQEKKTLSDMLNAIDDKDMQARLGSLGEAIMMDTKR